LWCRRFENSPHKLAEVMTAAGPDAEAVVEARSVGDVASAESYTKTYLGAITKQGSTLVRWSAIEAVFRYHGAVPIRDTYRRDADRRGRNIGRVAAARKLLILVYSGLRDPSPESRQ
jgi:hypothetical protein